MLPGNESRIVRHGTAQQTVVLAKCTKLKHGTKLGRTLCYCPCCALRRRAFFSRRSFCRDLCRTSALAFMPAARPRS